ncbi:hypothetical protein HQ531_13640 [bacterium]|nr:hypothetical protein [bacterium]
MKRFSIMILLLISVVSFSLGQGLKPYILGAQSSESLDVVKEMTRLNLQEAGFSILGEYQPAADETRWIFIVNSPEMIEAVKSVGELTGFAAAIRVGLTSENEKVNISYVNPIYLGNAYFQKNYPDVEQNFLDVSSKLSASMAELGDVKNEPFGALEGLEEKKIRHYHYMFGMEYFEDVVVLNEFSSFSVAKSIIDSKLSKGGDTKLIYSYEVPGSDLKLYGIGLSGPAGEEHFLPIIDLGSPKHTAFLPYEILLNGNTAVMLHGRYRIALAFPDLTMTTFGKIMSTPRDIEELLRSITE